MYRDFINKTFEKSKSKFDKLEIYINSTSNLDLKVFEKSIESYSISESGGVSLRAIKDGDVGYAYSENIDDTSIEYLIDRVEENLKYMESKDREEILSKSYNYPMYKNKESILKNEPLIKKENFLLGIEEKIKTKDKKVDKVEVYYSEIEENNTLANSDGIELNENLSFSVLGASVSFKDGNKVSSASGTKVIRSFEDIDIDDFVDEIVESGLGRLGSSKIISGSYNIVMSNKAFILLFSNFIQNFTGENVDKKISLLEGKEGSTISSKIFNLVDDPFYQEGIVGNFDGEGSPRRVNKIIDNGILQTFFYNNKTANIFSKETTGHAARSYKSKIFTRPTNLRVQPGEKSLDELFKSLKEGIYIDYITGLHAGIDPISGNFSISASGYEIKDGKILSPIELITIAGNFYDFLMDIDLLANDVDLSFLEGFTFESPSVLIKNISVSGE